MDQRPWLNNKKWKNNHILSGAKQSVILLVVFSVVWIVINALLFSKFDELSRKAEQEPMLLMILIFPVSGLWLLFLTFKAIRQWLTIGPTPLALDPFPGSIGGHIGGRINTNIAYQPDLTAKVALQCIYSYMSGTGKNRSRKETVKWTTDGVCHNNLGAKGTEFSFRFDVPEDLPETDVGYQGSDYHLWRVHLEANSNGVKLDRAYEIPAFKTSQHAIGLSIDTASHQASVDAAVDGVESIARLRPTAEGIEAWFPAFQRPGQGIMMLIFGMIFIIAGLAVDGSGITIIFPIVFSLIGGIIALAGIHYLAKALLISVTGTGVKIRRFMFGLPITTKNLSAEQFAEFKIKQAGTMQSGNKTTVYYRLYAIGKNGEELPVAERLTSRSEAEVIKESFERHISSS